MTAPKRGMVAGQPITSQANTEAFSEQYDSIFGKDRKPRRGRYVFDPNPLPACEPCGIDILLLAGPDGRAAYPAECPGCGALYDKPPGRMVEVGADWTDAERRAPVPTEELTYGNLQHTDGTPLNTRRKHRNFLKDTGSAMASDYSEGFRTKVKADRERDSDRSLDRATTEAITQLKNRRRRR